MPRRAAALRVALTLAILGLAPTHAAAQITLRSHVDAPRWRLYALEYAHSRGVAESRLVHDADPASRVDMSWYFLVAVGRGRVVLVDCGSDALARPDREGLRRSWSIDRAVEVEDALRRVGLGPTDVTDIVVTHHHWDHVGALARFPQASVHAHRAEWPRVAERLRRRIEREGRYRPLSRRSGQLWRGFAVEEAGRHTRHQLFVRIECPERSLVLVSDAAYLYRSIDEGLASAVTSDRSGNRADVARAVRSVGRSNVIPGHDPQIFVRYASETPGVAAICE